MKYNIKEYILNTWWVYIGIALFTYGATESIITTFLITPFSIIVSLIINPIFKENNEVENETS